LVTHFSYLSFHPENRTSRANIVALLNVPLEPDRRQFVHFANVIYSPIPYLASASAIALGRHDGLTPLQLLYLGRLANMLAFVSMGYLCLRMLPAFRRPFLLLLCMPMMLDLAGSLSADVITDSLAILLTSLIVRQAVRADTHPAETIGWRALVGIAAVSVALTLAKIAYFPLVGLVLLIPASRFGGRRRYALCIAALLMLNLLAQLYWTSQTPGMKANIRGVADPHQQLALILHCPMDFAGVVIGSIAVQGWNTLRSFVGNLGWLDTQVPIPFVWFYLLAMAFACWSSPDEPVSSRLFRLTAVTILATGGAMATVALLTYLFWDPVGDRVITGMQGRYFIPVAPAIFLLLAWGWFPRCARGRLAGPAAPKKDAIVAAIAISSGLLTLVVVFQRYYVRIN